MLVKINDFGVSEVHLSKYAIEPTCCSASLVFRYKVILLTTIYFDVDNIDTDFLE